LYVEGSAGENQGYLDHALFAISVDGFGVLTPYTLNGTNCTLFDNSDPDYELWYHDLDTATVQFVVALSDKNSAFPPGTQVTNAGPVLYGQNLYTLKEGDWDICYGGNNKHWDAATWADKDDQSWYGNSIKNTAGGYQARIILNDRIQTLSDDEGRTDFGERVAGEKAIYDDEFVTKDQIKAGRGVTIVYYDNDGVPTDGSYATDPYRRMDLLITSEALLNLGTDDVLGIDIITGNAQSWNNEVQYSDIDLLLFSTEHDWTLSAGLAIVGNVSGTEWEDQSIPIAFKGFISPSGTIHISGRTLHSGLFVSHENAAGDTVTQYDAGSHGSISHIKFKDTADGTFTISEGTEESHFGYRYGISVEYTPTPAVYSWDIEIPGITYTVTDQERVRYVGVDGVELTLAVIAGGHELDIRRSFQITEIDKDGLENLIGNASTKKLIFDNEGLDPAEYTDRIILLPDEVDEFGRRVRGYAKPPAATSAPVAPSFVSAWYRPVNINTAVDGNYFDFMICNQSNCDWREQITTPWGPLKNDLSLDPVAGFKATWEGPSGAFTKTAGKEIQQNEMPYQAGAMQVNQDGYYHIDIAQHNYMFKKATINSTYAHPVGYQSHWHLFLMVYRVATGEWQLHNHLDMELINHPAEQGNSGLWAKMESGMRYHVQGSCDVWLNSGDKISFVRSGAGRDYITAVPGYPGVGLPYAWWSMLTYQSFNIHWLHDDVASVQTDTDLFVGPPDTPYAYTENITGLNVPFLTAFAIQSFI